MEFLKRQLRILKHLVDDGGCKVGVLERQLWILELLVGEGGCKARFF